ncbi:MAG: hypothetical protein IPJ88_05030 [Myxococcales bacterium]|nr:MAG: hypothetical protein IPJ88_05030 [Myxococcales bacterium]
MILRRWYSLFVFVAACSFSGDASQSAVNFCDEDTDCPSQQCDLEKQVCVASSSADSFQLVIETMRSAGVEGAGSSVFSEVLSLGELDTRDFQIANPVDVFGTVRGKDNNDQPIRVLGSLRFVRYGPIEGLESSVTTQIFTEAQKTESGQEFDFSVKLLPGSYSVFLTLDSNQSKELPPIRFSLEVAGALSEPIDFPYPAVNELCRLRGVLKSIAGNGINRLEVQAVDRQTEQPLSTIDVTANVAGINGKFEIRLPQGLSDYVLNVVPNSEALVYPAVVIDPDYLFPNDNCQDVHEIDVPAPQSAVQISYVVKKWTKPPRERLLCRRLPCACWARSIPTSLEFVRSFDVPS